MKTGNKDRLAGVQFLDTANQGMTQLISFIKIYWTTLTAIYAEWIA